MSRGRHARPRSRRYHQVRSAIIGFVFVAACAGAILFVESQHDNAERSANASPTTEVTVTPTDAPTTISRLTPTTPTAPDPGRIGAATTTSQGTLAEGTGLAGKVVVLDPGHNGGNSSHGAEIARQVPAGGFMKECDTSGTQTNDGYPEHVFTFDMATRVAEALRAQGATVHLTRPDDNGVGPCVDERAASGADHDADVAISIHADGGPAEGRGFHVMPPAGCSGCDNDIVPASSELATTIRDAYAQGTAMPTSTYLGSNGIMARSDLAGINLSAVPKVFIECGNMRNADDAALLKDPSFRQAAADAIASGLASYLTSS